MPPKSVTKTKGRRTVAVKSKRRIGRASNTSYGTTKEKLGMKVMATKVDGIDEWKAPGSKGPIDWYVTGGDGIRHVAQSKSARATSKRGPRISGKDIEKVQDIVEKWNALGIPSIGYIDAHWGKLHKLTCVT